MEDTFLNLGYDTGCCEDGKSLGHCKATFIFHFVQKIM